MSNIVITGIVGVGQYAVPASDVELALASAGFDALLSTVFGLTYDRVLAMVDNPEGPDGVVGARTLRCMVEKFEYAGDENPLPGNLNALALAVEAKLEGDPDISTIGVQYYSLFESGAYFLWQRDAAGGFLYPTTTTDYLRAVGMKLDDQAAVPGGAPGAGYGTLWVKNTAPTRPYFTDSGATDRRLSYYFQDARQIYVSKSGSASGDGSASMPFNTIQLAVTTASALVPAPSATAPVVINIGPGVYDENVVVQCDYITLIGTSVETTILTATTGTVLCVSNATPASIAAYHLSGNYADLAPQVPPVAAVTKMSVINIRITTVGVVATNIPIELLGVAGDSGAGTTDFLLQWCTFMNCQINISTPPPGAIAPYIYARNCGYVSFQTSGSGGGGEAGGDVFYNANTWFDDSSPASPMITYVTGDPLGEPTWGNLGAFFLNCFMTDQFFYNEADIYYYNSWVDDSYCVGAVTIEARESHLGFLFLDGTSFYTGYGCTHDGNLDLDGTSGATIYGCYFAQDVIMLAGVGVVTECDCTFTGLVADPGSKLIHAGEDRYGVYTEAAGPGSRAIAFAPNFRNGSVLYMTIAFENTGGGYQTGMIATGTLAHTGFTLVTGGNGKFHWHAHKTN